MSSIFSKIIANEIPSYKIYENQHAVAFLDVNPLKLGHTLVVPKLEVDKIYNLPTNEFMELTAAALHVSKAIEMALNPSRVGWAVVGFEVPHAHIHLVPIDSIDELNFGNIRVKPTPEQMLEVVNLVQKYI